MKKFIALFLVLACMLSVTACGSSTAPQVDSLDEYLKEHGMTQEQLDAAVQQQANAAAATPVPTATPVPATTSAPIITPAPTATPAPTISPITPVVTPAPVPLVVTKNPTSEYLYESGNAIFVAYADGASYISWTVISPDGRTIYDADQCPAVFRGTAVRGDDSSQLIIANCPLSMDGWKVQCCFTSATGKKQYTDTATINVSKAPVTPITLSQGSGRFTDDAYISISAASGDEIYFELYRTMDGCARELWASGVQSSGRYVSLQCLDGEEVQYDLYAYVVGNPGNCVTGSYTVCGVQDVRFQVYASYGFDNSGYYQQRISVTGNYYICPVEIGAAEWECINEDGTSNIIGCGTMYLKAGELVMVYCSINCDTRDYLEGDPSIMFTLLH